MSSSRISVCDRPQLLMRLAVVERQLIMQALDLNSLARLASTCSVLRAEALHREAGRFISSIPQWDFTSLESDYSAHVSPLFRKHAPMRLNLSAFTSAVVESLLDKALQFSRITTLYAGSAKMWTEPQVLRLLSLPCMQHAERVGQIQSTWLESPRVQMALFSLPQLTSFDMRAGPTTKLLPRAIVLASKLNDFSVGVFADPPASLRALRALRLAPCLANLQFIFFVSVPFGPVLPELIRCLPSTLTHFCVSRYGEFAADGDLPRSLVKALFLRTPLLQSLELDGSIGASLQGMLDAGPRALPRLRHLTFLAVTPAHFSFDEDPDPIPPLLRRFLHRFSQAHVRFYIHSPNWQDRDRLSLMCYAGWPRVELYCLESDRRIGGPPNPHASDDDDDGSDVEEWLDPLASESDSSDYSLPPRRG